LYEFAKGIGEAVSKKITEITIRITQNNPDELSDPEQWDWESLLSTGEDEEFEVINVVHVQE
jgi:hypothetical protein